MRIWSRSEEEKKRRREDDDDRSDNSVIRLGLVVKVAMIKRTTIAQWSHPSLCQPATIYTLSFVLSIYYVVCLLLFPF